LAELQQSYDKAKLAIRARDDMLAMVSHDLRAPLHSMSLHIDALLMAVSKEDRRPVERLQLEAVRRAAEVMKRMLADLLDASKLDDGPPRLDLGRHSVAGLVAEGLERFEISAARKAIQIDLAVRPSHSILCDRDRMLQVLSNLFDNAIRHTPERGSISVYTSRLTGDRVRVSIANSGQGIRKDQLGRLFDRFWQGQGIGAGAAGLGLYIAKCITEAHGGTIAVQSEPGQGATFHLVLRAPSIVKLRRRSSRFAENPRITDPGRQDPNPCA
jgi:signal transduction histidine kinase